MFFTGHTHWHFNTTQPMLYGGGKTANYFNSAAVGYLWDDNDQYVDGSEGYYIEVYEKGLMVRGRDFVNGKWMPAAQFLIPMGAAEPGDLNGDGAINGQDSVLLQQYLAEWKITVSESGADVNGDGVINGQDAVLLQQYLAEWSVTLG